MKAHKLLAILTRSPLDYQVVRQTGSHRVLEAHDRGRLVFAFHDGVTIPGRLVKKILTEQAGLTDDEAFALL